MRLFILISAMFCTFLLFSCSDRVANKKMRRELGREAYELLKDPGSVHFSKNDTTTISFLLSREQIRGLNQLLLNEENYLFDVKKHCVFIPTYTFKFQKDMHEAKVMMSHACQQIRVLLKNRTITLEANPNYKEFQEFIGSLTKGSN